MITFAQTLRDIRIYRKLHQHELGFILGFTDSNISRWETGRAVPDSYTEKAILNKLFPEKISLEFNGYDMPTPSKLVYVDITELSARSPMGFRYATVNGCNEDMDNNNVADMGQTVGKEMFNGFNLWP